MSTRLTYQGRYLKWQSKFATYGFDPLTEVYIAGMTTPPIKEHQMLIDMFIMQTKAIIAKADVMYLMNINDSDDSFRNLVKDTHHGTQYGALVFDPYWGFNNPDSTGYVNMNYTPSSDAIKYLLNDAGAAIYLDYEHSNTQLPFGCRKISVNSGLGLRINSVAFTNDAIAVNQTGESVSIQPFYKGLKLIRRTAASTTAMVNQNITTITGSGASISLPDQSCYLFRLNELATNYYTGGISFIYIGASLSDAEYSTLNDAVNDYLIQCLFLKYGKTNWGVQMAQSYFLSLHNFAKYEAWEVYEFIKRHQSDNGAPVNMIPYHSSHFGKDGTGWWTLSGVGATKTWDSSTLCMNINDVGVYAMIYSTILTSGKTYRVKFKYKSSAYTGPIRVYYDATNYYSAPVTTTSWQYYDSAFIINRTTLAIRIDVVFTGTVQFDDIEIYDTSPLTELSINSGAPGLTDWVSTTTPGLGDGWLAHFNPSLYGCIFTIVTGNGFTGNAQRAVANGSGGWGVIMAPTILIIGRTYIFTGKWRSSIMLYCNRNSGPVIFSLPANTGDASTFSKTWVCDYTNFYMGVNSNVDWFEIDEISIKEYQTSDTSTFNKCSNSGFGLGTDWINPTNGLAQGWTQVNGSNQLHSIVTGNGFTNSAQRAERANTLGIIYIVQSLVFTVLQPHTIYLKYRSNYPLYINGGGSNILIGSANTGDASIAAVNIVPISTTFYVGCVGNSVLDSWFEVDEICIIENTNIQFLYNFFGPNGLNKSVADYIMLFKAGGNLLANAWPKTGATLRWNQDSTITNSNTMPAYTRGTNLGIVTVTTTDGWSAITSINIAQTGSSVNSFYGNFPLLHKLKTSGIFSHRYMSNRIKLYFKNINTLGSLLTNECLMYNIEYPGYIKANLNELVINQLRYIIADSGSTSITEIIGDVTSITNQLTGSSQLSGININYRQDLIIGSLANLFIADSATNISFIYTSISIGTSMWNKNCALIDLTGCKLPTIAVNDQLKVINDYFTYPTVPIQNLTLNLSGTTMGIPTDGAVNSDLLTIIAKHMGQGFTATITVRTS